MLTKPLTLPPIWLLIICSMLGPVAMTTPVPANTQIMRDFAIDYGVAQLVLTVFLLAQGVAQLLLGGLSDRFGRRPVMLIGLMLFTVGSLVCAWSPNLEVLLFGRMIQGAGAAVGVTLSRAIVRDIYGRSKAASVIGYVTMGMVVAPMIGPAVGGAMTQFMSWHYMFVGMAGANLILTLLVWRSLNETMPKKALGQRASLVSSFWQLLREPRFLAYTGNMMFAATVFYSYLAATPYYVMEVLGVSASAYGIYSIVSALGYMLGNFLSGRYAEKYGPDSMLWVAMFPMLAGLGLFWLFYAWQHPLAMFIPMFFITLSNGLTIPNALAASLSVRPDLAGSASGIGGASNIFFGSLIGGAVAFWQGVERWPILTVMTLSGLLSIVMLLWIKALLVTVPPEE